MRSSYRIATSFLLALLIALLVGCGSGSGGSGGGSRVIGNISGPSTRASADPITVSIEGTNLSTVAGADGSFAIDNVPPGLHTLLARGLRQAMAIVAEVGKGGDTNVGSIVLREAGQISGLVTSKTTHQPVPGAKIAVTEIVTTNTADALPHPVRVVRTDGSGSYTINGLPVGGYLVNIGADGFEATSLSLTVGIGTTTPGDAQLNPVAATEKGSMSGVVNLVSDSGDKQPLAGVLVRLTNTSDPQPMRPLPDKATTSSGATVDYWTGPGAPPSHREFYAFSDEAGAYKIDGVPAGTYTAAAVRPGLEPDSKPVTITATGNTQVDFDLKLRHYKVGIVEGVVTDSATKLPIANANVSVGFQYLPLSYAAAQQGANRSAATTGAADSIFIKPDEFTSFAQTDAQGHYQLKVAAGERSLNVSAPNYQSYSTVITVQTGITLTTDVALDPEKGLVVLSGKVVTADANGTTKPVAGAHVYAGRLDVPYAGGGTGGSPGSGGVTSSNTSPESRPFYLDQTTTDDTGAYKFSLHAGQYGLSATKDDYFAAPVTINLQSDTTQDMVMKQIQPPPAPNNK